MTTATSAALVVRYGLALLFLPFSALDRVFGFNHPAYQSQQVFAGRPVAVAMTLCGFAIEIVCTLGVVTGMADRASAFIIAVYCAVTAVLYKQF